MSEANRILIIGASSGIGAATAKALAAKGCALILHGRDEGRLRACSERLYGATDTDGSRDKPAHYAIVTGDVADWAENPRTIPAIEPVHAIIWSAGVCELSAGQMLSEKVVQRTLSVNLVAPLVVLSHFYRKRVIADGGKIILLGSQSAHDAGEGFSVYAASKGGLASAARVLNKEFSRRNISVRCIEPGTVNTPMTQKPIDQFGGLKGGHMENMLEPGAVAGEIVGMLGLGSKD